MGLWLLGGEIEREIAYSLMTDADQCDADFGRGIDS